MSATSIVATVEPPDWLSNVLFFCYVEFAAGLQTRLVRRSSNRVPMPILIPRLQGGNHEPPTQGD
jgi:hypothetical protein